MVEPNELNSCLFMGNMVAGRNAGHGLIHCQIGDTVEIGALLTKSGNLRFVIMGVVA